MTARRKTDPTLPPLTEADSAAMVSYCVGITALIARDMAAVPSSGVDPRLFESLQALRLILDREHRRLLRNGHKSNYPAPPELPDRIPQNLK